mmetsp:Transcript_19770/g.48520  ORF Transcript_19770/g.48520 Transcript_19770/m.48520 type:complete len:308 (+) Transcript_19770:212-1135(+)
MKAVPWTPQRVLLYVITVGLSCTLFLALHGPIGVGRIAHQPPVLRQADRPQTAVGEEQSYWIETIMESPRIFRIHNLLTATECDHLIDLGVQKGLTTALITPYGTHDLVASSTRTNTQAWLDFKQDAIVSYVEDTLAHITGTPTENGECLQILHYNETQQFKEHHDYFDPATDPPDNFVKGGNRMVTVLIYLSAAKEGGETYFTKLGTKLTANKGDAIMFFNMKPGCDGTQVSCVDQLTQHAGLPPIVGEKWVATKWIHERRFQDEGVGECVDRYAECSEWASRQPSECALNRAWMLLNCRKACTYC